MIGTKLAHFHITAHLGSGGMGDVYQATDSKLGRSVAIKLLPEAFARDSERVARFEREARVLASLNHPNIAVIYGLERVDGRMFLVMEYVPGETLAERIKKGPIPADDALGLGKQICEGLEAAHDKGVVHRDLKPANVKVTPEGRVKILDFGLAKAYAPQSSDAVDPANSPTLMSTPSTPGAIMGTAAYMSPEQAKGKEVDKRTDIFAFGCVLYEMLTGRHAFDGDDVSEIIAHVLTREPDWSRLPTTVPPRACDLLRLCLEKNPNRRRRDAGDVLLDIDHAFGAQLATEPSPRRGGKAGWIAAGVLALTFLGLAAIHFAQEPPSAPEMRLEISTPSSAEPLEFALSPDGRYIAFVASGEGQQRLWLRALDRTGAQPMAGTEGADHPFWSPDGRSIGFFASGNLKRVDIAGGSPRTLASVAAGFGGAWNAGGTILFSGAGGSPLFRVEASGGDRVQVTHLDPPRQTGHRFPQFLPDGQHFLFYVRGIPDAQGIYLGSLEGGETKRLAAADTAAAYLAPDMIVFIRGTTLMAQHLDLKARALNGDPATIVDTVGSISYYSRGGYSTSAEGRLAYRTGTGSASQFVWVDRFGKTIATVGEQDSAAVLYPELSPDGQRVAVQRTVQNNVDIWLMDLMHGGNLIRFTFDPANDSAPRWSPDGKEIAFTSNRKGQFNNIYLKPSNGNGAEQPLIETPGGKFATDWSSDGRFLLFEEGTGKGDYDLWAKSLTESDSKPIAIAHTPFDERNGQFSPDGHWVAYETNESIRFEIVVQTFPEPTGKFQVSTNGGVQPRWRADGKELYFIAPDGTMMASTISASGGTIAASAPLALFSTHLVPGVGSNNQEYVVSKDGRFLLNQLSAVANNAPITLILNWKWPK